MADSRSSFGFPLSVAVQTDVGRVRSNNEDSYGYAWLDDGSLFVIVCDGMGGHEAGEVASGLAVQVVEEVAGRDNAVDPRERLYNGLLEANEAILEEGRRSGTRGMGTTGISAILKGNEVHIGLVGDSRLFQIRKGQLVWRTLDHTRVQMLIDQGEITEEESRNHPEAGMLTRALGHSRMADGRPLVPDVLAEPLYLEENDVLVLSSDGLHDLMEDWEIAQMAAGKSPDEAADALVQCACDRGGHDNVTVAVVIAGRRGEPYDPDYVPETYEPYDEDTQAESTFDGYQYEEEADEDAITYGGGVSPGSMAAGPPPPMAPGGNPGNSGGGTNWLVVGVVLGGIALFIGIVIAILVAVGAVVLL